MGKVQLSAAALNDVSGTYADLREAANDILVETSINLNYLQGKRWYNRLWDLVTFSTDSERITAKGVTSVAKLQEIVIQALVLLYQQNEDVSEIIEEHANSILRIEKENGLVLNKIAQIRYGYKNIGDLQKMLLPQRFALAEVLKAFSDEIGSNEKSQAHLSSVLYLCNAEDCLLDGKDPYENVALIKEQKLLARILFENLYLATGQFDEESSTVFRKIAISNEDKEKIKSNIQKIKPEDIVLRYEELKKTSGSEMEIDMNDIISDDAEASQETILPDEDAVDEATKDRILDDFASQKDIMTLADLIRKEIKSGAIGAAWVLPTDKKKKLEYLAKRFGQNPPVEKTIIGVTKGASGELIFTTAALYWWRKDSKNISKIPYKKVSNETVGIRTTGGGKVVRSIFTFKPSNDSKIEIDDSGIAADHLISLLLQISECDDIADTDRLIAFNDLDESLQIRYYYILCGAIKYLGYELHEAFRFASDGGKASCWEKISSEDSTDVFEQIALWKAQLPYPSEEALCIQLASDIIKAIQYTKGADDLSSKERQVISQLYEGPDVNAIINYAQLEKRIIERKVDAKTASAIMDAFVVAVGASGISALTFVGANFLFWSTLWFNLIPGIGTILFAGVTGGAAVSSAISAKRNKALEEQEQHRRLTQAVLESYRKAQKAAYKDEQISKKLAASAYVLSNKSGVKDNRPDLKDWQKKQIEDAILGFLTREAASGSPFSKIGTKLSLKEKMNILSAFSFAGSGVNESTDDIIGLYDTSITFTEKYSGILFLKDRLFFRKGAKGALAQMRYKDILRVEAGITKVTIYGSSDTSIKITGITYTGPDVVDLFKRIAKIVV